LETKKQNKRNKKKTSLLVFLLFPKIGTIKKTKEQTTIFVVCVS
jgi:hypothetical protein